MIHARHFASSIGRLSRALQMESYPKFHNEVGVPIVRIGCREFKCIGDKPPQDHPHIYLKLGDASESSDPIALRYPASILVWAHRKLIRQSVHTVIRTEFECIDADFFVITAEATPRH